ncbi:MAG TPA: hypothetical protein PKM26_00105, partial [Syntrophorhabdaceae bacterium]|nr:hypothetical protein [Syntrophorhabdaceae bacterium]
MLSGEQDAVVGLIKARGPSTGLEIKKEIDMDPLLLWKACKTCEALHVRTLGRRYLRLDRNVDGFARLSPSILREFLTYSVVGLNGDPAALDVKCAEITSRTHKISRYKLDLARQMISGIMADYT